MADVSSLEAMTVVLVHGGFVDGSGWEGVYKILRKDGYLVSIVQNPTISLTDDVAATKRIVAAQSGPVILVGHSYGGAVITEAGNDPKVAGLVYITAFAPDRGESVSTLIKDPPPGAPVPPILPPQDGYLFLDKAKFPASFAADVDAERAAFMADSQVPWGVGALSGTISEPAWKTKPSWYLVATDDKMIPPPAQRFMSKRAGSTVVEVAGSHAIYVSQPQCGGRAHRKGRQIDEYGDELSLANAKKATCLLRPGIQPSMTQQRQRLKTLAFMTISGKPSVEWFLHSDAQQCLAADCLQPTLLRRSGFRQQLKASVRP